MANVNNVPFPDVKEKHHHQHHHHHHDDGRHHRHYHRDSGTNGHHHHHQSADANRETQTETELEALPDNATAREINVLELSLRKNALKARVGDREIAVEA